MTTMVILLAIDVLKHLAQVIREQVRETDITGRYGGEEFVSFSLGYCMPSDACDIY